MATNNWHGVSSQRIQLSAMLKRQKQCSAVERQLMSSLPSLRRFVASKINNPDDREDIVQETLYRSIKISQEKIILNPLAYALMVAKSLIINYWQEQIKLACSTVEHEETQSGLDIEQRVLDQARLKVTVSLIKAMPPLRKKVFWLRRIEGLSRQQIAQQLNISEESVKKHMTRALMDLTEGLHKTGWGSK